MITVILILIIILTIITLIMDYIVKTHYYAAIYILITYVCIFFIDPKSNKHAI